MFLLYCYHVLGLIETCSFSEPVTDSHISRFEPFISRFSITLWNYIILKGILWSIFSWYQHIYLKSWWNICTLHHSIDSNQLFRNKLLKYNQQHSISSPIINFGYGILMTNNSVVILPNPWLWIFSKLYSLALIRLQKCI